jgi:sterol desaturase/sphingolipid hydroxylase (fatty acid hydroxylase superfamily)
MRALSLLSADRHFTGVFLLVAFAFIIIEFAYGRLAHHDEMHDASETLASVGIAIGNVVTKALTSGISAVPFFLVYQHRLTDISLDNAWCWLALFVGVEFFYYWFHLASHRVRFLWATHAVHHSATRFNLSAAVRLGWTSQLTGSFLFFLPLAWIGFHPASIALMLALGLLYQFFLHTALPIHLGPLEWVLNTPRHHRVHHACNESCLDTNYGSTLIVFDRLFGTFADAPEGEAMRFGLKGRAPSNNPIAIAFGEWKHLGVDLWRASGLRRKLSLLFGPP